MFVRSSFRSSLLFCLLLVACGSSSGNDDESEPQGTGREPCEQLECGEHGSCVDDACACDSGFAGRLCDSCERGYVLGSAGKCVRELERTTKVPAGDGCEHGGVAVQRGTDDDGDGKLDPAEVSDTEYVCADAPDVLCPADLCGEHGTCVVTGGTPSCECSADHAGVRCDRCADGLVSSMNGQCVQAPEPPEPPELTELRDQPGSEACPEGVYGFVKGQDRDLDGTLDPKEIESTTNLCKVVKRGDVLVTNQAELEVLSSVTDIVGTLTIRTAYATALTPLSSLIQIQGDLVIEENGKLKALSGLGRLRRISGELRIQQNAALTTTTGMPALTTLGGKVTVASNPVLETLDLGATEVVGGDLAVEGNEALRELTGSALRSVVGYVIVRYNYALSSLAGFAKLSSVGKVITLNDADALTTLADMAALRDAGGLSIQGNDALAEVAGFASLETLRGGLNISGNPALRTIGGFAQLEAIDRVLVVTYNDELRTIAGFQALKRVGGGLLITDNRSLRGVSGFDVLERIRDNLDIPTQSDMLQQCPFGVCSGDLDEPTPVVRAIEIRGNDRLASITALSKLTDLTYARGGVYLANLSALTSLTGLPLESAGTQPIEFWNLTALVELPMLTTLHGVSTMVVVNTGLTQLVLPPDAAALAGAVVSIWDNPALTQIALPPVWTLGGLYVHGNAVLESVTLEASEGQGYSGPIEISENPKLTSIVGLEYAKQLSALRVNDNASLESLVGLPRLEGMNRLEVKKNPKLKTIGDLPKVSFFDESVNNEPVRLSSVTIAQNGVLSALPKLPGIPQSLVLSELPAVTTLSGMELKGVGATLRIQDLDGLSSLAGLEHLADELYELGVYIEDNDGLETLEGLRLSSNVSRLNIVNDDALVDLGSGIGQIERVNELIIDGNAQLATLDGFDALTDVYVMHIQNNPKLPQCEATALSARADDPDVGTKYHSISDNDESAICSP